VFQLISLSDNLAVSPQPAPEDMAALAAQGFTTVVCNRPDGESADQPSSQEMEAAAAAAGMKFVYYPVNPATFPGEDLAGLGKVFDSGDKVFAFCRTGTRCANLWVATRAPQSKAEAVERAKGLGFDLSLSERLG